jgi:hypothetical protein
MAGCGSTASRAPRCEVRRPAPSLLDTWVTWFIPEFEEPRSLAAFDESRAQVRSEFARHLVRMSCWPLRGGGRQVGPAL